MIAPAYRAMWLITMFDLPVASKMDRKRATAFRKFLLDGGFMMLQFSVYARYCDSADVAASKRRHIQLNIPENGAVRMLGVTDRQFAKMEQYLGGKRAPTERPPDQLLLF